jgi:hypothetical protein
MKGKELKSKLITISVTLLLTVAAIIIIEFFLFGLNRKPATSLSVNSPDGVYKAYVKENPSLDPPNQSLFISRNGSDKFRLVDELPEDIEFAQQIYWSPDSRIVVFQTNWYLIMTDVYKFNTKKISLNPDWWEWNKNGKAFFSSRRTVNMEEFQFINSDSLSFKTDFMDLALKICLTD